MTDIDWPTCGEDGCIGVRLPASTECLVHTSDQLRNATLKQLSETGEIDARGVPITQALLEHILAAAPHDADNHPTFTATRFDRATFQGTARFSGAAFHGQARFPEMTFQGEAIFLGVTFHGDAIFGRAAFHGQAMFLDAIFQSTAGFQVATFHGFAMFRGASFHGHATFLGATFQSYARFERASFHGAAEFSLATFQGDAGFEEATFQGEAGFLGATFERARQVGPLLAYRGLRLDDAQFAQPVQIEASTIGVCCRRARFAGGVQLRLRWAHVLLDDADLAAPSIVVGIPPLTSDLLAEREKRIAKAWQRLPGEVVSEQPRLLSLQRANVAGLLLAGVELADCRFAGSQNLDKLHVEDSSCPHLLRHQERRSPGGGGRSASHRHDDAPRRRRRLLGPT